MKFTHISAPQFTVSQAHSTRTNVHKRIFASTMSAVILCVFGLTSFVAADRDPSQMITVRIKEDGIITESLTEYKNTDNILTEQRKKLHPFDIIKNVGYAEDGALEIEIDRAPEVTILCDGMEKTTRACIGESPATLLVREGFSLGEYDFISPDPKEGLIEDCTVSVTRAFPVCITADGETKEVLAAGLTVGELLKREGIKLSEDDELNIPAESEITPEMAIKVTRVIYKKETTTEIVPYSTVNTDTPLLAMGTSKVKSEGINGSITTETTFKYEDGEIADSYVSQTVTKLPVDEIVENGTAFVEPYSKREGNYELKDGIPTEYEKVISGKVTAYTAREGCGTYSGRPLVIGSVGVDPNVIPFGSELYIVSQDRTKVYGYAVASDTGDITDIIADAYMGTKYEDALWWCAQYCDVYVLKTGDNTVSWRDGVTF